LDVHIVEGSTAQGKLPIVLGHEASGVVAELGASDVDAGTVAVGDRVTVNPMISAAHRSMCRLGRSN
jgi:L-iditol 2-dehydrogenase